MSTQKFTDDYIPSGEGEKLLGVKRNLFFYYVDSKQIRRKERKGEPDLYSVEDIIKVKDKRNKKKKKLVTKLDWMKISDLPAILKLDYEVYKENMVGDVGLYISWFKKNPKITLVSFNSEDRETVLGYISLVPLPEETIISILKGDRSELSIDPEEVETYDKKGEYSLLAESIVIHPQHPEQLNNIFREVLDYWCKQYPEKRINKIYAQATSEKGDIIVRKMFFSPLYYLSDNAYVLDLKKPGISRIVKEYQEHIRSKDCKTDNEQ